MERKPFDRFVHGKKGQKESNQSWVLVAKDDPGCGGSVDDQPTLITKMTIKKKKADDHKDYAKEREKEEKHLWFTKKRPGLHSPCSSAPSQDMFPASPPPEEHISTVSYSD